MKILCHPIITLCTAGNFGCAADGVFQWRARAESSGTRLYCWCLLFESHGWVGWSVLLHSFLSIFLSRGYSNLSASFHKDGILGSVKHVWRLVLAKLLMSKKWHGIIYRYICMSVKIYTQSIKYSTQKLVCSQHQMHTYSAYIRDRERERVCVCVCVHVCACVRAFFSCFYSFCFTNETKNCCWCE